MKILITALAVLLLSACSSEFDKVSAEAEQGDVNAQNNLGFMYNTGKGVAQDYKEAVKWYTKAAEQGEGKNERD
jgi:TPR repeat protein